MRALLIIFAVVLDFYINYRVLCWIFDKRYVLKKFNSYDDKEDQNDKDLSK